MVSESDYEFVVKAAKRFNYEFYIDTGVVYFRKAKQTAESCLMELKNSDGVLTYDITYDMTGIVKKVEVRGVDIAKGNLVTAAATVSNKISKGNKAKSLINQTAKVVVDANAVSKDQAQYRADSIMEDIAYRFGSLECECIGMPELMPGHFIRISDLGEPCNTDFYITHTRHVLNDYDGYHTYITAKAASLS
jgi:phage protein D